MIEHHYHRLIHSNENDLQLKGADSAPFNCHWGVLSSAQANQIEAEIMHTGQFFGSKRKRPAFPFANSIAGAFLFGVHPKKPAFMFVHAVTYTA